MKLLFLLFLFAAFASAQATGSIVTTVNIASIRCHARWGTLGGACTNYNTQYQTIDTAHVIKCANPNTKVTNIGAWTDITASAGGGLASSGAATIPYVLSGNTTRASTSLDFSGLFSGTGTYLKSDGSKGTPAGGGATLPTTTLCTQGRQCRGSVSGDRRNRLPDWRYPAACFRYSGSRQKPSVCRGERTPRARLRAMARRRVLPIREEPPPSRAGRSRARMPERARAAGSIYYSTDSSGGSPYYYRPTPGAAPLQFLTLGGSGRPQHHGRQRA
jgi:hypothetical protein